MAWLDLRQLVKKKHKTKQTETKKHTLLLLNAFLRSQPSSQLLDCPCKQFDNSLFPRRLFLVNLSQLN